MVPSADAGTLWELKWLRDHGHLHKVVLLMPEQASEMGEGVGSFGFSLRSAPEDNHRDHGRDWDRAVVATAQFGIRLPPYRYEGALFTLTTEGVVRRVCGLRLAEGDDKVRRLRALLADVRACSGLEGLAVERVCRLTDMTPRDRAARSRPCGLRRPPTPGKYSVIL